MMMIHGWIMNEIIHETSSSLFIFGGISSLLFSSNPHNNTIIISKQGSIPLFHSRPLPSSSSLHSPLLHSASRFTTQHRSQVTFQKNQNKERKTAHFPQVHITILITMQVEENSKTHMGSTHKKDLEEKKSKASSTLPVLTSGEAGYLSAWLWIRSSQVEEGRLDHFTMARVITQPHFVSVLNRATSVYSADSSFYVVMFETPKRRDAGVGKLRSAPLSRAHENVAMRPMKRKSQSGTKDLEENLGPLRRGGGRIL